MSIDPVSARGRASPAAAIQARIRAALSGLSLTEGRDFFLREADSGTRYVLLDLTWKDLITESLLAICSAAHGKDWGVLIGAFDPEEDDLRVMVEVSGGGFSYIAGGETVQEVVRRAYQAALRRMGQE